MPYSGDPSSSLADQVRFALGDTNVNAPLLSDGEVSFLLAQAKNDPMRAAIAGCYSILAKLAPNVDESVDGVSVTISQRRANYLSLLESLQSQSTLSGGLQYRAYAGGVSWADNLTVASDFDRVAPQFRRTYQGSRARRFGLPNGVPIDEQGW